MLIFPIEFNECSTIGDRFLNAKSDGYRLENWIQDDMPQSSFLLLQKSSPRRPQDAPRHANMPQEVRQIPPRRAQETPRCAEGAPQEAFRGTQDAARHTQDAPIHDKDALTSSKSRPDLTWTSILDHIGDDFD